MTKTSFRSAILALGALALLGGTAAAQNTGPAANTIPAKVQQIDVQFPPEIRRIGRSVGPMRVVKLNIVVQPDGKAGDVMMVASSGFDPYDNAAVSAARNATYIPAMDHGMAVESRLDYDVSFGLLCNRAAGNTTCDNGKYPVTCSATVCARLIR